VLARCTAHDRDGGIRSTREGHMRSTLAMLVGAVAGIHVLAASVSAEPPVCGNNACREEIAACVDSECEALSGHDRALCRRECRDSVRAACESDPTVCNPTTTTVPDTTTTVTTSSSTTTTVVGSPSAGFL
jgi:hypothetical protein